MTNRKPTAAPTILETQRVDHPRKSALLLGACLGADLGVGSKVVSAGRGAWLMVADDNRAIRFERP